MGGAFIFFLMLCFGFYKDIISFHLGVIGFLLIPLLISLYFLVYYFKKPKKEKILNRKDGLITFTGWYYQKNITMAFDKVIFKYSDGGDNGLGAFRLEVIRPSNYSYEDFTMGNHSYYDDISLITWFMDKNRPLPPGDAFDQYRQADFERRKAEGFPKPLYSSNIDTPEATREQQLERERIGGW